MSRRGGKRRQVLQLGESSNTSKLHRYGYAKGFLSKGSTGQGLGLNLVGDYSDSDSEDKQPQQEGESVNHQSDTTQQAPQGEEPAAASSLITTALIPTEPTAQRPEPEAPHVAGPEDDGDGPSHMDDELRIFLSEIEAIPMPEESKKISDPVSNGPSPTPSHGQEENNATTTTTAVAMETLPAEPFVGSKKKAKAYSMFVKGEVEFAHTSTPTTTSSTEESQEVAKEKGEDVLELVDIPEEPTTKWQLVQDEATQYYYYWDWQTNAVTWEIPSDYTQYLLLHREYEEKMAKLTPLQRQAIQDRKEKKESLSKDKTSGQTSTTTSGERQSSAVETDNGTYSHQRKKRSKKHKRRHDESEEELDGESTVKSSKSHKKSSSSYESKDSISSSSSKDNNRFIGPQSLSIVPYLSDNDDDEDDDDNNDEEKEQVDEEKKKSQVLPPSCVEEMSTERKSRSSSPSTTPRSELEPIGEEGTSLDSETPLVDDSPAASRDNSEESSSVVYGPRVCLPDDDVEHTSLGAAKEEEAEGEGDQMAAKSDASTSRDVTVKVEVEVKPSIEEDLDGEPVGSTSTDINQEVVSSSSSPLAAERVEENAIGKSVNASGQQDGKEVVKEELSDQPLLLVSAAAKEKEKRKKKKEVVNMFAEDSPPRSDRTTEMSTSTPKMEVEDGEISDSSESVSRQTKDVRRIPEASRKGSNDDDVARSKERELVPAAKSIVGYSEEDEEEEEEEEGELKEEPAAASSKTKQRGWKDSSNNTTEVVFFPHKLEKRKDSGRSSSSKENSGKTRDYEERREKNRESERESSSSSYLVSSSSSHMTRSNTPDKESSRRSAASEKETRLFPIEETGRRIVEEVEEKEEEVNLSKIEEEVVEEEEEEDKEDLDDTEDLDLDDLDNIDRVLERALEKKRDQKPIVQESSKSDLKTTNNKAKEMEIPTTGSSTEGKSQDGVVVGVAMTNGLRPSSSESQRNETGHGDLKLAVAVKESTELALNKLRFLDISTKSFSKLQVLLVELQTRYSDWQAGGLLTTYFHDQLKSAEALLGQYEENAVPAGWLCQWDSILLVLLLRTSYHNGIISLHTARQSLLCVCVCVCVTFIKKTIK